MYVSFLNKKTITITIKRRKLKNPSVFLLSKDLMKTLWISMPATKNGIAFQKAKILIHCRKLLPAVAWEL